MSSPYDLLSPSDKEDYVRVRQATKLGYIEVKLGGGSRPFVSHKSITQRESSRRWSDLSYANGKW